MTTPSNSLRLLFFCAGSYVAGVEVLTLSLMKELQIRGHAVRCVVNGWNDGEFPRRLSGLGIPHDVVKLGFIHFSKPLWTLDTLIHYPGALRAISRVCKDFRPDYTYHTSYRSVLMLAPVLQADRTVLHVHEADSVRRITRLYYRIARRRTKLTVAVSNYVRENLLKLGVPENKVQVVHNGVEIGGPEAAPPRRREGVPVIAIVGQVIERKGHGDLIRALALLRRRQKDFRCRIFGRGSPDFTHRLKSAIHESGLDGQVDWMGFVSDREEIYRDLDLVVVPSRDPEAFGLVAVEPALWSIPVVASRSGGLVEIVQDGVTGLLFEPGNVGDLADKIERLLDKPDSRIELGKAARCRVVEHFTLDRMVDEIERILTADEGLGAAE